MIHVEIWSDVLCPYCYIGKRHLEAAIARFGHAGEVRTQWKSFQLDPNATRSQQTNNYERLARKYGQTIEWAKRVTAQLAIRAEDAGLKFDFDRAIPTNSLDAHRLVHLASAHGLTGPALERLFAAHFMEGLDIGDVPTLQELGTEIGLDAVEVEQLLAGDRFRTDVESESLEARSLGVTGVPFFLLNRQYAVSGAQPVDVLVTALKTVEQEAGK
jgi:predicted DsbA family dithiol-disulfide isomerase